MRPMDEQQQFDELNANRRVKLAPKKVFEALLNVSYDPIANAMRRHPGLTQETAEAIAKAFRFKKERGLMPLFSFVRTI